MNKISKFTLVLFAMTAVANVGYGMSTQKETNAEQILQEKLKKLKEEKEKAEASWFNKVYRPYKCFGDEPHFTDSILTWALVQQVVNNLIFPLVTHFISVTQDNVSSIKTSMTVVDVLFQVATGTAVQKHKTGTTVRNEKIKDLEDILEEMKKGK